MIITEEQRLDFMKAAKPLMDFMEVNFYPHVKCIVDSHRAELVEGVCSAQKKYEDAKKCDNCGKPHGRKRFCSNKCKDRYHNKHNPRGYGAKGGSDSEDEFIDEIWPEGWDGHKEGS